MEKSLTTTIMKEFYIPHKPVVKKTYCFSLPALKVIHDYLSNRKQQAKINL